MYEIITCLPAMSDSAGIDIICTMYNIYIYCISILIYIYIFIHKWELRYFIGCSIYMGMSDYQRVDTFGFPGD
jgi:hypothetical protein